MPSESSARLDRIEANLDRLTQLGVQSAESLSVIEHIVDKIAVAVAADGENIRALVRIAEAHERRIDDLENGDTSFSS
jgi:hypothetical protein